MITQNVSTLKIHKLTKEQYDRELAAGRIDPNALYFTTTDEEGNYLDMNPGIEYITEEKYNGKPVYTMLVDCGAMPNTTSKRYYFSNEVVDVHSFIGIASGNGEKDMFPVVFSFNIVAYAYTQHLDGRSLIVINTNQDLSTYTATFVLKYTKSTD